MSEEKGQLICQGKTVYLCTWKSAKLYVKGNVPLCVSHQNDMLYAKEKGIFVYQGKRLNCKGNWSMSMSGHRKKIKCCILRIHLPEF